MAGFCTSADFENHLTGPHHPERPDRIRAVALAVRAAGLIDSPNPFPNFQLDFQLKPVGGEKLLELEPYSADEKWIRLVHSAHEIEYVRKICGHGGGVLDQGDTPVCQRSFEIAKLSCGAVLRCCDAVMGGEVSRAFAAVRPPGHHAEPDRPMGFCLFGNVAIAARYLQKHHGIKSVAIVDFDVHHGNGTQAAFEDDPSVLFISLHQHPRTLYPGSGYEWEVGEGAGRGTTMNIPMAPGSGDGEYLEVMQNRVLPALDLFKPEVLLISAGFDAHRDDPLSKIELSEGGFEKITNLLVQSADANCGGRVISALEGGYDLRSLGRSLVRHLVALRGNG
jgi:acetoin utilization deacetylase AcuC-like enzyme